MAIEPDDVLYTIVHHRRLQALADLEMVVWRLQLEGMGVAAINLHPAVGEHRHAIVFGELYQCQSCTRLKWGETPKDEICPECRATMNGFSKNGEYDNQET